MGFEYAEKMRKEQTTGSRTAKEYIRDFKKTKTELKKRAGELKKRADQLKQSNPELSAELMKRSKILTDEAEAMSKSRSGGKGLTTEEIRRAAALGRFALIKDKV